MRVAELIRLLQEQDPDAEVWHSISDYQTQVDIVDNDEHVEFLQLPLGSVVLL